MAHAPADTDDEQSATELNDGLDDVRESVTNVIERIDSDSNQIEKAVARAFIGGANAEAAEELRKLLASQISEFHENQPIALDEIVISLWIELLRASEMATQDPNGEGDEETENDQSGESDNAESQEGGEGLGQLFSKKDTDEGPPDETSEGTADPAFQ